MGLTHPSAVPALQEKGCAPFGDKVYFYPFSAFISMLLHMVKKIRRYTKNQESFTMVQEKSHEIRSRDGPDAGFIIQGVWGEKKSMINTLKDPKNCAQYVKR